MRIGNIFIAVGIFFLIVGFFIKVSPLKLFHLPGDIVIKKKNFIFYFPLTTSIILSLIISLIFYIFKKIK